ncbi:putative PRAME family member 26 [Nannospalax galili]|uniref:putative PRAME family member 26 n=1 Tax=Nannospalax galili TaxID=1026970 RepID=UPI00111BE5D7|nr:putative PRAME family member 26 [Nannospalax galili]
MTTAALNPASLLLNDDPEQLLQNCTEVTDLIKSTRPDLTDIPLSETNEVLYIDGSSFIQDGTTYAVAAVTSKDRTIWTQSLNRATSTQKAKLTALTDPSALMGEWKLQVLSLQNGDENIWKMGCGRIARACSELPGEVQRSCPGSGIRTRPLKILADLCITFKRGALNDFQAYLLHWVAMRKQVVQLCCRRLQIFSDSIYQIQEFLHVVCLDSIEELEMNSFFHLGTMKVFASYLARMSNLQKFSFDGMSPDTYTSVRQSKWYSHMYAVHLQKLDNLQEIYINDVFFLKGQLHNILRSHTPLKTLSLKSSPLLESDLKHLSECPSTGQLKHLTLSNIDMADFSPQPLRALLEKVAGTLETLVLDQCFINDSHISCILPALDASSHLTTLSSYGNHMSISVLEKLMGCTDKLSFNLKQVLCPVPSSFEEGCWLEFNEMKFLQVSAKFRQLVMDLKIKHKVR